MSHRDARIAKIRILLQKHNVDAILVRNNEERKPFSGLYYLTGFSGTHGYCVITKDRALFATDLRYTLQAQSEVHGFEFATVLGMAHYFDPIQQFSVRRLGVFEDQMSWGFVRQTKKVLGKAVTIVPLPDLLLELRATKEQEELAALRVAVRAIEQALEKTYTAVRPGATEKQLARILRDALPDGVDFSFPPIIASGTRSALPHGFASDKALEAGDLIQFDVGCVVDFYASDISRVVVVGTATTEHRAMYTAVMDAIDHAVVLYKPDNPTKEAHEMANRVLNDHGYPSLPHGLGHGIGLDVHEWPRIGPTSPDTFFEGNVVTIEPGIYVPNKLGMRIEREVLITKTSPQYIDILTRDLLEL